MKFLLFVTIFVVLTFAICIKIPIAKQFEDKTKVINSNEDKKEETNAKTESS
jgi:hypothetical protein